MRREIGWMPPRGTAWLWPVRILTDFGKSTYVLWALAVILFVIALLFPRARGTPRSVLIGFGTRILVPVFCGAAAGAHRASFSRTPSGADGRSSAVKANAFNFSHFSGSEAYASFPSGHATTAFALAFAVSALWPQPARCNVRLCRCDRLEPSRSAGAPSERRGRWALLGVIGAMLVRYWFAARHLAFTIRRDGAIVPLAGTLAGAPQKGCPEPVRPIRSGRRQAVRSSGSGSRSTQAMSIDLSFSVQPLSMFPSSCRFATRPATSRR